MRWQAISALLALESHMEGVKKGMQLVKRSGAELIASIWAALRFYPETEGIEVAIDASCLWLVILRIVIEYVRVAFVICAA